MSRFSVFRMISVFFVVFGMAGGGWATEVRGSFTYDGRPVAGDFPELAYGLVSAYNTVSRIRTENTIDVASGNYVLDLEPGTYNIQLVLVREEIVTLGHQLPGEMTGFQVNEVIPAGGPITLDFSLLYLVHVTAPFDNDTMGSGWGGSVLECPFGPEAPTSFRLEWEAVPGVESYEVLAQHFNCSTWVSEERISTSGTNVVLSIDPAVAEAINIFIRGFGTQGSGITTMPTLLYDNGSAGSETHWVHGVAGGEGRPIHPSDSLFLLQVARLQGVGSSFWTSDITISNPGPDSVLAKMTFTVRGAEGLIDYSTESVPIPAHSCRTIKDVVGSLFGLNKAGSLEIAPSSLRVYARTATAGDEGSYGQSFPSVAVVGGPWVSVDGGEMITASGIIRGLFRTNLILAEIWGEGATVRVRLVDRNGLELGSGDFTLPAFGNHQINDLVLTLTGDSTLILAEAQVELSAVSGGGRVAGALSIIDQDSDDPITVLLE